MITPTLVVLCGGTSSEREVSLGSGMPCAMALSRTFPTRRVVVEADALPQGLDPSKEVIFSTLHGTFGEDGGMQHLLERAGLQYAGSDAVASALTFDKERTKEVVSAAGVAVAPGISFSAGAKPTRAEIVAKLGHQVVFKPRASGSSVGLAICENLVAMEAKLAEISSGEWIVERRIVGREVTVGILNGRAMGVVEIIPDSGIFDYRSKYTKGLTQYRAPAPLSETRTRAVQAAAQTAFQACGCRDYARIDFMLSDEGEFFLLEINTLPGMKETSLLPMSAQCVGLDFTALVRELVAPAVRRFQSSGVLANSL